MSGPSRAAVVTGLGALTPLGADAPSSWEALLAGRSGVGALEEDGFEDLPVRIAARAAADPAELLGRTEARHLDRCAQFVLATAREAWEDAGNPDVDHERLGAVVGTSIGGLLTTMNTYERYQQRGWRGLSPFTVTQFMPNSPTTTLSIEFGAMAGAHTTADACASGAEALSAGLQMIRSGRADAVIVAGADATIHPLPMASFCAMRAVSTRNDEPERASRPFDAGRDGFVMGEGAAVLVLESAEHARRRGAHVYAELAGAGISADAHHVARPDPTGTGAALAMRRALADGQVGPADVVHINAHATSTEAGDIAEAKAIHTALEGAVDGVAVSATKSMTGHLLGGAGALESLATVLALRDRTAPPTINLETVDPEIKLDIVGAEARSLGERGEYALSNSFGFGGHNVSLLFRGVY
jgi:3-oxoacyl-[acyl-carrier-protein] synthase II